MSKLEFHLEFQSEVEPVEEDLIAEADNRLRTLAEGHRDMIGASVAVEELTGGETPHVYQVRAVAYIKPENVVGIAKDETLELALGEALDAIERQVRKLRDKQSKPWQRPPQTPDTLQIE